MGQNSATVNKIQQSPTPQEVEQNIEELFEKHHQADKADLVNRPIIIISRNLSEEGSFQQKQAGFHANPVLLKCIYHPNFEKTIINLLTLLIKQLKTILESRLMALVPRQKFRKTLNIANFCIFFTNETVIQTVNLLSVRSDLSPQCKQMVLQLTKENPQINQQLIEAIQSYQLSQMAKVMRISMNTMIDLHLKLITRSDFTLSIIDRLNQSLFVLYLKIFFSQVHQVHKRQNKQNAKNLLKIASYFLGLGIQMKTASIYELAVLLLQDLLTENEQELGNQKALPSHLFKSLPVISNNQMMHWLTSNILYTLTFKKEGATVFNRLNINRIPSYKLLSLIFYQYKPHDHQITYLLQEICLQTKTFQIQRVYASEIAKIYSELQSSTDIIRKFTQLSHISYNIKGINKEVKVRPEDVRTQLEDDQETLRKQVICLYSKYTLQVIFHKNQVTYDYSDKALWNIILNQIEEEQVELKELEGTIHQKEEIAQEQELKKAAIELKQEGGSLQGQALEENLQQQAES